MTTRDVRDMLGLSADAGNAQRPAKRPKKTKAASRRTEGVSRELFALMGERAPPIPIQKPTLQYRKAPRRKLENVRWKLSAFDNQARKDGLQLKHWTRHAEPIKFTSGDNTQMEEAPVESDAPPQHEENKDEAEADTSKPVPQYPFVKYNVAVDVPTYTDEQYAENLQSDSWTKEETDYLMDTYSSLYGKWPVVYDRYEYTIPGMDSSQQTQRTLEELKARYYEVAHKMMAIRIPQSSMTASEFHHWEIMKNYDPKYETQRKMGLEKLLRQNLGEKREQEYLLAELRRIYEKQEKFTEELRDLRQRLDHGVTDDKSGSSSYQTSSEITALYQKIIAGSRNQQAIKRRSLAESSSNNNAASAASPSTATPTTAQASVQQKRPSIASPAPAGRRTLDAKAELRFGVSSHDKLSSGVNFKGEKINKLRSAKSHVQTQKIAEMLAELGIPDLLQMPTNAVCDAMESLVSKINLLLDARKLRERENNEIMVAEQQKQLKAEKAKRAEGTSGTAAGPGSNDEPADEGSGAQAEDDDEDEKAEADAMLVDKEDEENEEEDEDEEEEEDEEEKDDNNDEDNDVEDEEEEDEDNDEVEAAEDVQDGLQNDDEDDEVIENGDDDGDGPEIPSEEEEDDEEDEAQIPSDAEDGIAGADDAEEEEEEVEEEADDDEDGLPDIDDDDDMSKDELADSDGEADNAKLSRAVKNTISNAHKRSASEMSEASSSGRPGIKRQKGVRG